MADLQEDALGASWLRAGPWLTSVWPRRVHARSRVERASQSARLLTCSGFSLLTCASLCYLEATPTTAHTRLTLAHGEVACWWGNRYFIPSRSKEDTSGGESSFLFRARVGFWESLFFFYSLIYLTNCNDFLNSRIWWWLKRYFSIHGILLENSLETSDIHHILNRISK